MATDATIVFKDTRPVIRIDPETGTCSRPGGRDLYTDGTCSVPLNHAVSPSRTSSCSRTTTYRWRRTPAQRCTRIGYPSTKDGPAGERARFGSETRSSSLEDVHENASPISARRLGRCARPRLRRRRRVPRGLRAWRVGGGARGHARPGPGVGRRGSRPERRLLWVSRAWEPFRLDLNGAATAGANALRVTVTNTMANQFLHTTEARPLAGQRPRHLPQAVPGPGAGLHQKRPVRTREHRLGMMHAA